MQCRRVATAVPHMTLAVSESHGAPVSAASPGSPKIPASWSASALAASRSAAASPAKTYCLLSVRDAKPPLRDTGMNRVVVSSAATTPPYGVNQIHVPANRQRVAHRGEKGQKLPKVYDFMAAAPRPLAGSNRTPMMTTHQGANRLPTDRIALHSCRYSGTP